MFQLGLNYLQLVKLQHEHNFLYLFLFNSVFPTAEERTHFLDQGKSRMISQLVNGISEFSKN